jgi:polysaccharide export outer membrane protein
MKPTDHPTPVVLLASLLAGFLLTGCTTHSRWVHSPPPPAMPPVATARLVTPEAHPLDPALLQRPTGDFTLGPGDELEIELLGDPATHERTHIGPDGKIYFYILPGLDVWGLTVPQTRDLIAQEMQKYVREQQQVAVTLRTVESKRIWLLGRLNNPGVYAMTGPMTLLEAISLAGGPASASAYATFANVSSTGLKGGNTGEAADLSRSFVMRHGRLLPVDLDRLLHEGDLSQNIYLQSDDFIYLPSAVTEEVHVLGAVTQPRAVNFVNQLSLAEAIANAGGTIKDAYLSHVAIVRGSLTAPQIAIIDYNAVVHGEAPDVQLEPRDIVYVPFTPYRTLERYANLILDTFVRTVGVNEGARAVSSAAGPVGVNVQVVP